jgi:predicted GNAT family acetyltransferase
MDLAAFSAFHRPALLRQAAKYTMIMNALDRTLAGDLKAAPVTWSLDRPGACAFQSPGWPIILGDLTKAECEQLADEVAATRFVGVSGAEERPRWFVERARALGARFNEPVMMRLLATEAPAIYPDAPGATRVATPDDAALMLRWLQEFRREATPEDPEPTPEEAKKRAASGDCQFWMVDGEPVAMAGIVRRAGTAAAISLVYTVPEQRGRGFAGAITATLVDRAHREGFATACLYVDRNNPISNRCYEKIGFKPLCDSSVFWQA